MANQYCNIRESSSTECLKDFAVDVVELFEGEYLRPPNSEQTVILLQRVNGLVFSGMLGIIDCCKLLWMSCPTAYHGQHKRKGKVSDVTIKAISDD